VLARVFATALATVAMLLTAVSTPEVAGADGCLHEFGHTCPGPVTGNGSEFDYQYIDAAAAFYAVPSSETIKVPGGTTLLPQEYLYQPDCPDNRPPGVDGAIDEELCAGAISACTKGDIQEKVFQRDAGTDDTPRLTGVICIGPKSTITLQQLTTQIHDHIQIDLSSQVVASPPIDISPPTLALVNLPVIAATALTAETLHITEPLVADVQITPVPTWDFGDGSPKVTGVVGVAYDGTSALDDPGHYPLTHTYAKPGDYTVTLTVLWTAVSVTTAQHPDPIPLPDPQPTATSTTTIALTAHEAHAVLVSGG
jgi:PKD domain